MKSLNKLFIMLLAGSLLPMFFSCNDIKEEDSSASSDVCTVKFNVSDETSRMAVPEVDFDNFSYILILTQDGRTFHTESWASRAEMNKASLELKAGSWTFSLNAYSESISKDEPLLTGETTVDVKSGSNNIIFIMQANILKDCKVPGSFETKITVDSDVTEVTASIYDIETNKPLSEDVLKECGWTEKDGKIEQVFTKDDFYAEKETDENGNSTTKYYIIYRIDKIPTGNYMLVYEFKYSDGRKVKYRTIVIIIPENNSFEEHDTTEKDVNAYYLFYDDNSNGKIFERRKQRCDINEEVDLLFDEFNQTSSDENEDIINYTLAGWATSPNGKMVYTKTGTTKIKMTANTTLYAIWKENIVSGATITISPPKYVDENDLKIVLPENDDPDNLTGTTTTFISEAGFKKYLWLVNGQVVKITGENSIIWDYSSKTAGTYNITVIVTAEDEKTYSASIDVTIKKGSN